MTSKVIVLYVGFFRIITFYLFLVFYVVLVELVNNWLEPAFDVFNDKLDIPQC